jgi:hypothetical protein
MTPTFGSHAPTPRVGRKYHFLSPSRTKTGLHEHGLAILYFSRLELQALQSLVGKALATFGIY